ncbi:MAG TPA: glycosyltransferase, partial [Planctomycetota bacterium]|nr:glycosyltransferase [Planctomycetota bacterium]
MRDRRRRGGPQGRRAGRRVRGARGGAAPRRQLAGAALTDRIRVTACVLTRDEETNLPACLASLAWADAIQVLDSGSRDRTIEIAKAAGAEVHHRNWTGFGDQRIHQFGLPATDWLFWLDAD